MLGENPYLTESALLKDTEPGLQIIRDKRRSREKVTVTSPVRCHQKAGSATTRIIDAAQSRGSCEIGKGRNHENRISKES